MVFLANAYGGLTSIYNQIYLLCTFRLANDSMKEIPDSRNAATMELPFAPMELDAFWHGVRLDEVRL